MADAAKAAVELDPLTPLDLVDRAVINALQGGFPVCEHPFAAAAADLGIEEQELIDRIAALRQRGVLTRFGPLFNADRFGGHNSLVAMAVPEDRFEAVAALVNAYPEVAHNYQRHHHLNMWFVLATEQPERVTELVAEIAQRTGLAVFNMPKQREFHVHLRLEA